jgi:hypothetical protein
MNSGDKAVPNQFALAAVEDRREPRSRHELVGFGEAVCHDHFLRARRLRQAAAEEVELVEAWLAVLSARR